MLTQRIVRSAKTPAAGEHERWLAEGRAALRELELAGGSLRDLDHASRAHPQAFCRLVEALRELGAEIDTGTATLVEAAPQATVLPLPRNRG